MSTSVEKWLRCPERGNWVVDPSKKIKSYHSSNMNKVTNNTNR